ncbi:peptidoglycan-binding domain-containing protein [Phormidesmis priestleyi]
MMPNSESPNPETISSSYPQGVGEVELHPWDLGESVEALQTLLNAHGFVLRVDGEFNSRTEAAVRVYQAQHHLRIDGVVGAKTWAMLKKTVQPGTRLLKQGDAGADVYELQGLLGVNGYQLDRNGLFDADTQSCVVAFQQKHKLRSDGVVGTITWNLLRGKPLPPPPPQQKNWFV